MVSLVHTKNVRTTLDTVAVAVGATMAVAECHKLPSPHSQVCTSV